MNKKFTLLFLTALTIAVASNAQINKGATALGGNVSFYTSTNDYQTGKFRQTNLYVAPSFTSFYKTNRAVGFYLYYAHSHSDSVSSSNGYGAGVFLRQYKTLAKSFYIFAQEELSYSYFKGKYLPVNGGKFTQNVAFIEVNPGLAYDLNKHVQFELLFLNDLISANYSHTKNTDGINPIKTTQFSFGANTGITNLSTLNIGAKIFFGR